MKRALALYLFTPLACLAVAVGAEVVVTPTYTWTGASKEGDSVQDAANWAQNSPAVPTGDGSENLVFGEVLGSVEENVLVPVTAAFKDIAFTGTDRPRYFFQGGANAQLILAGNVTASEGGDNRSAILASSLQLGLTAGSHTVDVENIVSVFAKIFDFDGVASLVKKGTGGLYLSGTDALHTFSGGVTVEQGTLFVSRSSLLDDNNVISGPVGAGTLTLQDGTTLYAFNGAAGLDNPVVLHGGTATLDGSSVDSLDLRGDISGPGLLRVAGAGEVTLSGSNTYAGGTLVNAGTLTAAGGNQPLGTGSVVVNSGATLRLDDASLTNALTFNAGSRLLGDGWISTATIGDGVTLSPGRHGGVSVGTLSFQDLVLEGGGTYEWTLRNATLAAGTGWDRVNVFAASTLHIDATANNRFTLKLISSDGEVAGQALPFGFNPDAPANWLIFSTSGIAFADGASLADSFAIDASQFGGVSNDLFSLTRDNNNLLLTFTPIPEPSTYFLMATGLAALGYREWRRRQRK